MMDSDLSGWSNKARIPTRGVMFFTLILYQVANGTPDKFRKTRIYDLPGYSIIQEPVSAMISPQREFRSADYSGN
jgi:hypothetical protein